MKQVERSKSSHAVNKITVLTHWNLHYVAHFTLWGSLFAAISLVVLWTHWPALSAKALSFDDNQYLTENTLVQHPSWASAKRFFGEVLTPSTVKGYYQPLTMISLMLDCAMGGDPHNLRPFHRTSLSLHAINTALIILVLYMLFDHLWVAAMIGLLFGVHPMTVEPIAWLGDRKTLLAAFFALLTLVAYLRYAQTSGRHSTARVAWYGACIGCYLLALMSKPTTTLLSVMLLLMDYWPLERLNWRAVLEKIPFFVVTGMSAVITLVSQGRTAPVGLPTSHSTVPIILGMCYNTLFYPCKMLWPVHLSSMYPHPEPMSLANPQILTSVIGVCVLILALAVSLRWTRALLTGWLMFFVVILPTLGGIGFTIVIASDKYAYLPSFGILMILSWCLIRLWSKFHQSRAVQLSLCTGMLILAGFEVHTTRRYLEVWQDTEHLYQHMLNLAPNAWQLHYNMGFALADQGRPDAAIGYFQRTLELKPDHVDAHINLGAALATQGRMDEAIVHYHKALRLQPDSFDAHNNLGAVLLSQGRIDEAIEQYRQALKNCTDCADAHNNLGLALTRKGRLDEAINQYEQSLHLKPDDVETHNKMAAALAQQGKNNEAINQLYEAVRLNPDFALGHKNLGQLLAAQGKQQEAIAEYEKALRIDPRDEELPRRLKALTASPK